MSHKLLFSLDFRDKGLSKMLQTDYSPVTLLLRFKGIIIKHKPAFSPYMARSLPVSSPYHLRIFPVNLRCNSGSDAKKALVWKKVKESREENPRGIPSCTK